MVRRNPVNSAEALLSPFAALREVSPVGRKEFLAWARSTTEAPRVEIGVVEFVVELASFEIVGFSPLFPVTKVPCVVELELVDVGAGFVDPAG